MKTNVAQTSINAYRQEKPFTAREKVARYILQNTKQGRPVWIGRIADELGMEKSSASGRLNEIKKHGATIDGVWYVLALIRTARPKGGRCAVEQWALVLPGEAGQLKINLQ